MKERKHLTNHSSNEMIRDAIRAIALKGVVNRQTGAVRGTSKVTGFVAKVHTEEDDELFGTIDVQEYPDWAIAETEDARLGYHEGVLLTAIQNNTDGYIIIPKLHSDVLVSRDPDTGNEYVTMFSHVDLIQLDSHEKVIIGVREREEYDPEDEDAPDVHELELTGIQTTTEYKKDSVKTVATTDKDSKHVATQVIGTDPNDGLEIKHDVSGKSTSTMTEDDIVMKHDKSKITLDGSQSKMETGDSSVIVENGTVYVGSKDETDDAVLGQELASILSDLVGYLSQMMTPTAMGPQAPANMLANFIALKAKIQSFASNHNGFLTKKVQIQKQVWQKLN